VAAYPWPEDLLLPRMIAVGGSAPFDFSSQETVRQYERGAATLAVEGVWFDGVDGSGDRKLMLYPPPGSVLPIELEYVYRPAEFIGNDDVPTWMPYPFHKGLLYSACAVCFETVEDNPELGKWNQEKADSIASELRNYDVERGTGNGVFQIPVVGWTAPR